MRFVFAPLLAASAMFMGISGCPPQSDCPPPDGLLTAGEWGSDGWSFTVDADGTTHIYTYCAQGVSQEPVYVTDGFVSFAADMIFEKGGPGTPGVAKVSGTVCDGVLEFTYSTDYGYNEDASVTYGQAGTVEGCPLD